MDLLDVNVLVALAWQGHIHHDRCHRWFAARAGAAWGTTPVTEAGLVRVSLTPAAVGRPVAATEVMELVRRLRAVSGHVFLPDSSSLAEAVIDVGRLASHRQVTDLHLVNLAATHSGRLVTLDHAIPEYLAPGDRRFVHVLV